MTAPAASQLRDRLVVLARALTLATRSGRAEWSPTGRDRSWVYRDVSGSVTLAADPLNAGHTLEVLGPDGHVLETLRSPSPLHVNAGNAAVGPTLSDLHAAVAEQGQRTERVIDGLLSSLQRRGL